MYNYSLVSSRIVGDKESNSFDLSFTDWSKAAFSVRVEHLEADRRYHEECVRWLLYHLRVSGIICLDWKHLLGQDKQLRIRNNILSIGPSDEGDRKPLCGIASDGTAFHLDSEVTCELSPVDTNTKLYVYLAHGKESDEDDKIKNRKILHLVLNKTDTQNPSHLLILKILWKNQQFELDESFIPDCLWTDSHFLLEESIKKLRSNIRNIISQNIQNERYNPSAILLMQLMPLQSEFRMLWADYLKLWATLCSTLSLLLSSGVKIDTDLNTSVDRIENKCNNPSGISPGEFISDFNRLIGIIQSVSMQTAVNRQSGWLNRLFNRL